MELPTGHRAILLDLARMRIRSILTGQELSLPPQLPQELHQNAGCFVTLHELKSRRLRGCIGSLDASRPMCVAVWDSAEGVLNDPRFTNRRITARDLPELEIEVSVLSPLREAQSPLDFSPADDGIFLTIAGHTGCFLPQVARETGWSKEQLLARLCTEKMGLDEHAWKRPDARLQTFTVLIAGPEPF